MNASGEERSRLGCLTLDVLEDFNTLRLADAEEGRVAEHLVTCSTCSRVLEELQANASVLDRVRSLGPVASRSVAVQIAGCRVLREIGRGGMGVVFEAEQEEPRRRVAIKLLRYDGAPDSDRARLFEREIASLARLDHAGIASIYTSGKTDGGERYFSMELVRGLPLLEHVDRVRPTLRQKLEIGHAICEAMAYAHRRGVLHRDLKPSNILVSEDGQPKVVDFGLARILASDEGSLAETVPGRLRGTPAYMSPEQALGEPDRVDVRSDVYSLGILLYQLATGELPYDLRGVLPAALTTTITSRPMPTASSVDRRIPREFDAIVAKATEKEPDARFASAAELAADLGHMLRGEPVAACQGHRFYLFRKLLQRHMALAVLVPVLLVAVLATSAVQVVRWVGSARIAETAWREGDLGRWQQHGELLPAFLARLLLPSDAANELTRPPAPPATSVVALVSTTLKNEGIEAGLLLAARYLERDGFAVHPTLVRFLEWSLGAGTPAEPEVRTTVQRLVSRLFLERPDKSARDVSESEGLRRRMLLAHETEPSPYGRMYLSSALVGCATPAEIRPVLERAHARLRAGEVYALEEFRLALWCVISVLRRTGVCGFEEEIPELDAAHVLQLACAEAVSLPSHVPTAPWALPIEPLFRAVAFARRRSGLAALELLPAAELGIRPEVVLAARSNEGLWASLAQGPAASLVAIAGPPAVADYWLFGRLVGSFDRKPFDSVMESLVVRASTEGGRDVERDLERYRAGLRQARSEALGGRSPVDGDSRLGSLLSMEFEPLETIPAQHVPIEVPSTVASWDFRETTVYTRGRVEPPRARWTTLEGTSPGCYARLGVFGRSELRLAFVLTAQESNAPLQLTLHLQKGARWTLPDAGEAFLDVRLDDKPLWTRLRWGVTRLETVSKTLQLPFEARAASHVLSLRLTEDSNTSLRVARVELEHIDR